MIRVMALLVVVAMVCGLIGCGGGTRPKPDTEDAKKEGEPKEVAKKDTGPKKDSEPKKDPVTKIDPEPKKDGAVKKDGVKPSDKRVKVPDLPPDTKVTRILSSKYGDEYKEAGEVTTKLYKGRFLELTGLVTKIGRTEAGKAVVELDGAKGAILGVLCHTVDRTPWLDVLPGQVATIRGIGPDTDDGAAALKDCYILAVSGEKPPELTAAELSMEFGKSVKEAEAKYNDKPLVVTGEVASVDAKEDEPVRIIFKLGPGTPVLLKVPFVEEERAKALKPGTQVRAIGNFKKASSKELGTYVELYNAFVLQPAP